MRQHDPSHVLGLDPHCTQDRADLLLRSDGNPDCQPEVGDASAGAVEHRPERPRGTPPDALALACLHEDRAGLEGMHTHLRGGYAP